MIGLFESDVLGLYAAETVPPPGYSLETEVEGIRRVADDAGSETFHLVGYLTTSTPRRP